MHPRHDAEDGAGVLEVEAVGEDVQVKIAEAVARGHATSIQ